MFRASFTQRETWRAMYHRYRSPRTAALQRYIINAEKKQKNSSQHQQHQQQQQKSNKGSHITAAVAAPPAGNNGEVPHKYNRFWVNEDWDFVSQHAVVEDPAVSAKRRQMLPEPTNSELSKTPRAPHFEPFAPFLRVVDYSKDPDAKYMKPVNVPRWKQFMLRSRPEVPRTWY